MWTGVGLSLVVLGAWFIGVRGEWQSPPARLIITDDAIFLGWSKSSSDFNYSVVRLIVLHLDRDRLVMWPRAVSDGYTPQGVAHAAVVPLWLLLLLTAIPTAWLWHRDRRRIRPGCCLRCGYDLTGNTSGVCSECGLAKPPPAIV